MATPKTKTAAKPVAAATNQDLPQRASAPTAVSVIAQTEGFRRAGRVWSKAPTIVPIEDLSDDDLQALRREPKLSVAFVADEGEPC